MAALGLHEDQDVREAARRVIMTANGYEPTACLLAMGEFFEKASSYSRAEVESAMHKLSDWRRTGRITVYGLGAPDTRVFDHVAAIRQADRMVTPCDATIIAAMLDDEHADGLVSTDSFVSYSRVAEYVEQHNKQLFPLQGGPPRRRPGGNARSSGKTR